MTVTPVDSFGPATTPLPPQATTNQLDKDAFLKLMVAQLRNQDPLNPQDSSEFLAQTAQFTQLEKLDAVATQSAQSLATQVAFGASSLAGRTVTYLGEDGVTEAQGTVGSVRFTAGGPMLQVGDASIPVANVVSVDG